MILDTNAVSALLAGDRQLEQILSRRAVHELPVIVIGEYRYGLRRSRARKTLERALEVLIDNSVVLSVDADTTIAYATVREQLRRGGTPLPENDVWIAALALQHDVTIVSRDAHFAHVEGVRSVRW
jgi:predicted nucleic acid-binding protein